MKKLDLIEISGKADLIIWGARMTGLGALRFFRHHGKSPVCYADSDPAFRNKTVGSLSVFEPADLKKQIISNNWNPIIIIAAALKESDIIRSLKKYDLDQYPRFSFQSSEEPTFTVDILGSCNLVCGSCPHSIKDHGVPRGSMGFETVKKVIDKIKVESPETTHISLYSWGEPLLHPRIPEIVDYVHGKGIAVALSTNLSLSFDKRIENLVKSEPEYLKISVSGYYPEAYNATHQGGDVELVKKNLYMIRKYMNTYNSNICVDINYHLYRDNNGKNLEMFKALASDLGFILSTTYALVMPLERVINYLDGKVDKQTSIIQKNLLVDIDEAINVSSHNIPKSKTCPFRENQININADLTVPVCCTVFERGENIVAKNFLSSDLNEIAANKATVSICKICTKKRLPEYNMGFNQHKWASVAKTKISLEK